MNLKNYTSEVAANQSIVRIESRLAEMGAKSINKEFKDGVIHGIKFLIDINGNTVVFELPARIERVFDVMWKEISRPRPDTKKRIEKQAERTAWKIIADWVDVQASMVYLEQAEVMQVFLPYALMPSGETVYTTIQSNGMKALTSAE